MSENQNHPDEERLRSLVRRALDSGPPLESSSNLRRAVEERLDQHLSSETQAMSVSPSDQTRAEKPSDALREKRAGRWWMAASLAAVAATLLLGFMSDWGKRQPTLAALSDSSSSMRSLDLQGGTKSPAPTRGLSTSQRDYFGNRTAGGVAVDWSDKGVVDSEEATDMDASATEIKLHDFGAQTAPKGNLSKEIGSLSGSSLNGRGAGQRGSLVQRGGGRAPSPTPGPQGGASSSYALGLEAKPQPTSEFAPVAGEPVSRFYYKSSDGEESRALGRVSEAKSETMAQGESEQLARQSEQLGVAQVEAKQLQELRRKEQELVRSFGPQHPEVRLLQAQAKAMSDFIEDRRLYLAQDQSGNEQYDAISDNPFNTVKAQPLSTFSIDVDTASYANVRRFLTQGQLPPADAVRIEELVNYFSYDYPQPTGADPFSVNMETSPCPWKPEHTLLRVGLKGKDVHKDERGASNLVFLIDVSGSMSDADKLPLVKQSLHMLTRELRESDKVTMVTYAGNAGLVMEPTSGKEKSLIATKIDALESGGSTHGSAGIQLAYEQARAAFVKEGNNRVILCTDGDLNVGVTSDEALVDLITQEAKSGVFLTVLGFGQGNLKDSKMEKIADRGNGVYAYIDGLREARKVLVEQMSGSLVTIAKDVKIQIEFNPAQVQAYRLIGYENRILAAKDFNDDKKDAGEIGAGHTVTALYELVPAGVVAARPAVEKLKYQSAPGEPEARVPGVEGPGAVAQNEDPLSKELLTLKLRYKQPDGDVSKLLEVPLSERGESFGKASTDFRFAASVAAFGMALRHSPYRGDMNVGGALEIASAAIGNDEQGYRAEFVDLIRRAQQLGVK